MLSFLNNISPTEIGVLALILIFFFGPKITKSLGKMSGETVREIKNIKNEFTKAIEAEPDDEASQSKQKEVPK